MTSKTVHLLIVEDEEAHVGAIRRAYETAGVDIEIRSVGTLREFRAYVRERPPDLVLMDLKLPDGRAVEEIKCPPQDAPFPILVMTAYGNQQIVLEVMRAGALDYVVKSPEAFADMPHTIDRVLREWTLLQDHKRAEVNLKLNEQRLRRFYDSGLLGVIYWNMRGQILDANDKFLQMVGYTRDELTTGKIDWINITPPEYRRQDEASVAELKATGVNQVPFEKEYIRKDGTRVSIVLAGAMLDEERVNGVAFVLDVSERKQAEEETNKSDAKLKALIESTSDWVWETDAQGLYTYSSPAVEAILGYKPDEIIGKTSFDLMPENERSRVKDVFEALVAEKTPLIGFENVNLHKDGHPVVLETSGQPFFSPEGRLLGYRGIDRDITERKQTEEKLENLSRFPEENPSPVLRIKPDGTLLYANPSAGPLMQYWGCRPGQKLPAEWVKLVADTMASGEWHETEVDCYGRSYLLRLCQIQKAGYVNVYGSDITERKQADRELLEAKKLVDSIVENIPLMIFLKEAQDLKFVVFNRAGEELLGYDRKALLGKNNLDLFPPEQAAQFMAKDREVLDGKAGILDIPEEPILTAKQGQRLLHTRKICIKGADGVTKYLLGISEDITERKRAENELLFRNLILSTQQETTVDGILVVDAGGKIISSNRRFAEMWNIPQDVMESNSDERALQSVMDKLANPEAFIAEVKRLYTALDEKSRDVVVLKDGRTFDRYSAPMIGKDGKHFGRVWYFRDITGRKKTEERQNELLSDIETEKNKLASLIDSISDEIWFNDNHGNVKLLNPTALREFGLVNSLNISIQDLAKNLEVLCPDGRPRLVEDAPPLRALAGEMVRNQEEIVKTPGSGELRYRQVNSSPVKSPDGTIIGAVSVVRDITKQRRAERDYRLLFQSALNGFALHEIIVDAAGKPVDYRYLDVNPAFERMTGLKAGDIIGRTVLDIMPDTEGFWIETYGKVALTGESTTFENFAQTIGKHFYVMAFRPAPMQFACFFEDITERKKAEEKREELEGQLRVSQKMEAIGNLAGGIAHDFNNLLSVILSYTQFTLDSVGEGDPKHDDLLEVKKAAERAASLTRQLLAFGRKQVLQSVPLNLNEIVAGIEKMLQRILGEDISLLKALAPDLGLTLADPGQIEQVLMNLVVNARDAMVEGGKLSIKTSNVEIDEEYAARHVAVKPGPYVLLEVSDTGCGMDKQTQAKIFDPFFTTKEKGKGTGLGLPMVYGIVKQSGGSIWVYSEPGQGATFKIFLPLDLSAVTAAAVKSPVILGLAVGTETILVVEDEEALRKVAKRTLDAAGYTVLIAANGDEAILASDRHKGDIHLLLTDVVMPGMSGRTLAQGLSKTRPALKVLYMSGYTDDAIIRHGVLDAGTHFLGKPFTSADLTRRVREVLNEGLSNPAAADQKAIQPDAEREEQPIKKDALRELPKGLLEKLRQAVIAARYDEIIEIVGTIRLTQPDMATGLGRMAERYDYVGLRDLLGRGDEGTK
jgi:PAS domain S-box-containing protein